jgi:hypothetical protein
MGAGDDRCRAYRKIAVSFIGKSNDDESLAFMMLVHDFRSHVASGTTSGGAKHLEPPPLLRTAKLVASTK